MFARNRYHTATLPTAMPDGGRRRVASALWVFLAFMAATGAARAEDPGFPAPTGDASVVASGAKLDRIFDGGCMLTEGVATSPDGMVYFSDITFTKFCKDASGKYLQAGNIWKWDPKTRQATIFRSPSGMSNGMKFDSEGNLVVAEGADFGGRRLTKTDMKTGKSYILTGLYNGQPYNALNDLTIDEKGASTSAIRAISAGKRWASRSRQFIVSTRTARSCASSPTRENPTASRCHPIKRRSMFCHTITVRTTFSKRAKPRKRV